MMKVLSAQHQRNGISGRPFYAAIVEDPFDTNPVGDNIFYVISLDYEGDEERPDGEPNQTETFVILMNDFELEEGWRGDRVPMSTLMAIRKFVNEKRGF